MNPSAKNLLACFRALGKEDQHALLAFGEFLRAKTPQKAQPTAPLAIARPEKESVVGAMKRLSKTYPMLNKEVILHQASAVMSQHVMGGKSAQAAIDDLEALFRRAFDEQDPTQ